LILLVLHQKQIVISMKNIVKILIGVLIIMFISNFIGIPAIGQSYSYQTSNKEFTYRCVPSKGNNEEDMIRSFEKFKKDNPGIQEIILYRTFEIKWWKFWKWKDYMTSERYSYPYID